MSRKRTTTRDESRPPATATHYDTLGVNAGATADEIRTAYRRRAKRLHPDVSASEDAQSRFAEVARAYEVLSDSKQRRDYDAMLAGTGVESTGEPGMGRGGQAHYTWRNVATEASGGPEPSELDELYETFFVRHKPAE